MSTILLSDKGTGLTIRRFCGPVRPDGGPRDRFEISRPAVWPAVGRESRITLSREEMLALVGPLALRGLENPVVPDSRKEGDE